MVPKVLLLCLQESDTHPYQRKIENCLWCTLIATFLYQQELLFMFCGSKLWKMYDAVTWCEIQRFNLKKEWVVLHHHHDLK
jgi:hypothetical protein